LKVKISAIGILLSFALAGTASLSALTISLPLDAGDTRASATSVNGLFTTPSPGTVFGAPAGYTATVQSSLHHNNDVDWFSFTGAAGQSAFFDVDNDPYTVDTILSLFDAAGTLLAFHDDSFPEDPGTEFGFDAFLGTYLLPTDGTYYLAVSGYGRFPTASSFPDPFTPLLRPDGVFFGGYALDAAPVGDDSFTGSSTEIGGYTVHLTLDSPQAVPDSNPHGWVALLGLLAVERLFRRRLQNT